MIGAGLRQQKRADAEPGACFSTSNGRAPQRGLTLFGHDAGNRKQNPLKPTAVVKAMLCSGPSRIRYVQKRLPPLSFA